MRVRILQISNLSRLNFQLRIPYASAAPRFYEYFAASYRTTSFRPPYRAQAMASHRVAIRSCLTPQCPLSYCPGASSRSCPEEAEWLVFKQRSQVEFDSQDSRDRIGHLANISVTLAQWVKWLCRDVLCGRVQRTYLRCILIFSISPFIYARLCYEKRRYHSSSGEDGEKCTNKALQFIAPLSA